MSWKSPIKTARLCFYRSGRQLDHYMMVEDDHAARKLLNFLLESDAVILSLENFSPAEIRLLEGSQHRNGRSLFASTDCSGLEKNIQGDKCARLCVFNADADGRDGVAKTSRLARHPAERAGDSMPVAPAAAPNAPSD
jgi:hypothetical protein